MSGRWHRPPCQRWQDRIHVLDKRGVLSTLNGSSRKLVDKFTYLGTSVSSSETDLIDKIKWHILNAWRNIEQVLEATPYKTAAVWPPTTITKTIQVRRTRHAEHCRRSKDELISDTGCSLENQPGAMDDSDGLRERVREIRAGSMAWWWWWWWSFSLLC